MNIRINRFPNFVIPSKIEQYYDGVYFLHVCFITFKFVLLVAEVEIAEGVSDILFQ